MALTALDEVVEQCRLAPVHPTPALRFVLAWLYDHSGSDDRSAHDAYWRTMQDDMATSYSEATARTMRGTSAQTALVGIARQSGIELTADVSCELRQARMKKAERMEYKNSACYKFAHR